MGRRHLAMHRVLPADERLDPDPRAAREVMLRLIDDLELLAAERLAKLMLDHAPPLERLVHAWLEAAHALATIGLGAGERDIGVPQQRGRVVAVARR